MFLFLVLSCLFFLSFVFGTGRSGEGRRRSYGASPSSAPSTPLSRSARPSPPKGGRVKFPPKGKPSPQRGEGLNSPQRGEGAAPKQPALPPLHSIRFRGEHKSRALNDEYSES